MRITTMARSSDADVLHAFHALVNMTAPELKAWLETDHAKSVGQDSGDGESIGRKAGRRTLRLLGIKRAPNADDIAHMRRVVGFIRRHLAQGPRRKLANSRWRYALMNWGHDPLKPRASDGPWGDGPA
jgi:Protein of unknown function (DUF3140)